MGHGASKSDGEHPPWEGLMHDFLALLDVGAVPVTGDLVCNLFVGNSWFQQLVERRVHQAVESYAVPENCRDDMEQTILLLFLRKARKTPDLHVKRELVEAHFGGLIWSIVDDLGLQAIRSIRRHYRCDARLMDDVACRSKRNLDSHVDVKLLVAELPILTQTILALFEEGHTLTEIAELVGEKYWKVCQLYRNAITHLRERLGE